MMVDVLSIPLTTHLVSLTNGEIPLPSEEGLIRWASRELHTYRKTLCSAEFTHVDRRLYGTIEELIRDSDILDRLHKCDACSVLLQFALANAYFKQRDYSSGAIGFEWCVPNSSFAWIRSELEASDE